MGKDDKLKNLDWTKIQNLVINKLKSTCENIKVEINQALNGIEKSDGKKVSFGGFDEFWTCSVDSKSCYLHVQIDHVKFTETKSNNIIININFWGMDGKKISIENDIDELISTNISENRNICKKNSNNNFKDISIPI
jgi:hypothetical protein